MKLRKYILLFALMSAASWSLEITDGCDLPDSEATGYLHLTADGSVLYKTLYPIGGFQFTINGALIMSASGGAAGDAGFMISTSATEVLGFSLSGTTIEGCGTLIVVIYEGDATGISGIIVSDATGNQLYFEYYEDVPGCTAMDACNYDAEATADDGSCIYHEENYDCDGNCTIETDCAGECGGSLLGTGVDELGNDECGVCGGPGAIEECGCEGIPDGACDCDGNISDNCGICDANPSNDCVQDCNSEWGGSAVEDNCGICGGPCTEDPPSECGNFNCENQCVENCEYDCFGVFQGTGEPDECFECIDCSDYENDCSSHPAWNASCSDCNDDLFGSAYKDGCNVCVGGNTGLVACLFACDGETPIWDSLESGPFITDNCGTCDTYPWNDCEIDCNGIWDGTAEIDNCGHCVYGDTEQVACTPDCNGVWGGDEELDECGVCGGSGIYDNCGICDANSSNDCEQDCNGVWGGDEELDECGACGESGIYDNCGICDANSSNDCVQDCAGNWGGSAVEDECGFCGGYGIYDDCGICDADPSNDCVQDCAGNWGGTAYEDNCDICDADPSNDCVQDCEGAWDGSAVVDECGICDGSGIPAGDCDCFGNILDQCGICDGEAYFLDSAGELCQPGSSADCLTPDELCDCNGNELDECGVCGGDGAVFGDNSNCCEIEVDACGVCNGPGEIYECGCYSIPDLTTEENNVGYLAYCNCPESFDENGDPEWENVMPILADCAGVCDGSAVEDDCGACLLPLCEDGDFQEDWTFNPCDDGKAPQNSEWNTNCIDCNGIFNGPTQYDCTYDLDDENTWVAACGGDAVYDCRYLDTVNYAEEDYCSGDTGCGDIETEEECTSADNDLTCEWIVIDDYCNGTFLGMGEIHECYGYSNTGQWILKTGDEFDTEAGCTADTDGDGNPYYFWIETGKDKCGVCDGPGPIYTKDENGEVIEGGECCEADLDECGVCGAEIGTVGPGLANSGECAGDAGCDVYTHNKEGCNSNTDVLNCYWGAWCDCSGTAVKDCQGNCPDDGDIDEPYIGDQGTFGHDACGVCDGDGAVFGNSATCCEAYSDTCGGCHQGDCSGDEGCEYIENKAGCLIGGEYELTCVWTDSQYDTPSQEDPLWNISGCASPGGIEDADCSIYCDCEGNIADCYGACGGSESLVGIGCYECIGGNYDNKIDCETNAYLWMQIGNDFSDEPVCDGTDFGCLECTGDACVDDDYDNSCYEYQIDVCGLCYGPGVGEGLCDCFDNIGNCAGDCPTNYMVGGEIVEDLSTIEGNPGMWQFNEDYEDISGDDIDGYDNLDIQPKGDGICDDEDLCISSGESHLIFMNDGSITDTYFPSVCLDVCLGNNGSGAVQTICELNEGTWHEENYTLNETECNDNFGDWIPSTPNPAYGGYDICGVCNGDGFTCGFEAEGALNAVHLTWNKPNLGSIESISDSLGITSMNFDDDTDNPILFTAGTGGLNEMNSTGSNVRLSRSGSMNMSSSLFSSTLEDDLAEICSEYTDDDTTVAEYGFYPDITPAVSIEIRNVDIEAGTLDFYMKNIPACYYCENPTFNNNNFSWDLQKEDCESFGWNWVINYNMGEAECANVPGLHETVRGGWWFDGSIKGFQFYIRGVTITGVSGGSAEFYLGPPNGFVSFVSNADCDADGIYDPGCGLILVTSTGDSFIPANDQSELLLSATFIDFDGKSVCFDGVGKSAVGNWSPPVISDASGYEVLADWGNCYCDVDYPADECGVCGGTGGDQFCGCGLPGNCELQPNACDCTGRLPSERYDAATALVAGDPLLENQYICWDEAEVCNASECEPDPNAVSYNVYHQDIIGNYIQIASNLSYPHYTDANIGYENNYMVFGDAKATVSQFVETLKEE